MRNDLTELIAILDMSGSMYTMKSDIIGGFNSLIEEQKKLEGDVNVTTVLFNDKYMLLHDRENIRDICPITGEDYVPHGVTAMLDTIGRTITSVGQRLSETPEEERSGKVLVVIMTDGYENASREYNWGTIHAMIKEQREKYSWIFTFIGADIDTMRVGQDLGIDSRLAKTYTKSSVGTQSVFDAVSKSVSKIRANVYESAEAAAEDISGDLDEIE